jgi:hypothetical protein
MSTYRYAFALAGLLAASAPLVPAMAASTTSPKMTDYVTADAVTGRAPVTGVYDGYDQYRDERGFPLPGWDYLFFSPT